MKYICEEKDYDDYHRSERRYWDADGYYDNEPEDYVIEVLEMLETAKCFFRKEDIDTAYEAYKKLFEIINYPEKMGHDEIFISDFSFETAIGNDIVKESSEIDVVKRFTSKQKKVLDKQNLF